MIFENANDKINVTHSILIVKKNNAIDDSHEIHQMMHQSMTLGATLLYQLQTSEQYFALFAPLNKKTLIALNSSWLCALAEGAITHKQIEKQSVATQQPYEPALQPLIGYY